VRTFFFLFLLWFGVLGMRGFVVSGIRRRGLGEADWTSDGSGFIDGELGWCNTFNWQEPTVGALPSR